MKIIVTENQYRFLLESINPCPKGKKEDSLVTIDDILKGKTIDKGYCNSNPNSALVKIQQMLQNKGLLDIKSYNGYYGDKTQMAIKKLWSPETVEGIKIGKKTYEKLKGEKLTKKGSSGKPVDLFKKLTTDEKILVCTLIGEAGGETDAPKSMQAVANVLQNRAEENHLNKGKKPSEQALAKSQFSMWNDYNSGRESLQDVYNKFKNHRQMSNAIKLAKSISSLKDITGDSLFYYAANIIPPWIKETDTTYWKPIIRIGNHKFGNIIDKKKK